MPATSLSAVILAAGRSSRLPRFKQLLPLGGESLLARAVGLFRAAGVESVLAVTGTRAEEVGAQAEALGLRAVYNPRHEEGMFTSVLAGLADLPADTAGVFVLPVDIPLVRPCTVRALVDALSAALAENPRADALIPEYLGQPGHPPLIRARALPRVLAHGGEAGAGGLAGALAGLDCVRVPVADRHILFDVDDDAAFAEAEARLLRWPEPDPAEAAELMRLHGAGARGLAHGRAVADVALALARGLMARGAQTEGAVAAALDLELLEAAALVHDIAKGQPAHEAAGARLLAGLGFPRTAAIVADHRDIDPAGVERLTERELAYLADKLVRGPEHIGIPARFQEKLDRFRDDAEAVAAITRRLDHALAMAARVEREAGTSIAALLAGVTFGRCA